MLLNHPRAWPGHTSTGLPRVLGASMIDFPDFIRELPLVDIGVPEITVYVVVGAQPVARIEITDKATAV